MDQGRSLVAMDEQHNDNDREHRSFFALCLRLLLNSFPTVEMAAGDDEGNEVEMVERIRNRNASAEDDGTDSCPSISTIDGLVDAQLLQECHPLEVNETLDEALDASTIPSIEDSCTIPTLDGLVDYKLLWEYLQFDNENLETFDASTIPSIEDRCEARDDVTLEEKDQGEMEQEGTEDDGNENELTGNDELGNDAEEEEKNKEDGAEDIDMEEDDDAAGQSPDDDKFSSSAVTELGRNDFLLGRGHKRSDHPGNQRVRKEVVVRLYDTYMTASKKAKKDVVNNRVIHNVRAHGGRFLEQIQEGKWTIADDDKARRTIGQLFREITRQRATRKS